MGVSEDRVSCGCGAYRAHCRGWRITDAELEWYLSHIVECEDIRYGIMNDLMISDMSEQLEGLIYVRPP